MKFGDDYINGIMYEKRIRPLIISRPGKHSHVANPPPPPNSKYSPDGKNENI